MNLGTQLRSHRERLQLSQADLAARAETTQATVSRIEVGAIPDPGVALVGRLAKALGLTIDVLVSPQTVVEIEGTGEADAAPAGGVEVAAVP